jgi:hypothetical protein
MQSMVISLPLSLSDTHRHTHMLNTIIFLLHIKSSASFNPEHKCVHSHSRNLSFNLLGYDSLHCAVERGLMELRKLGIENQLWQASRRGLEVDSNSKANLESDFWCNVQAVFWHNNHCNWEISSTCSYQLADNFLWCFILGAIHLQLPYSWLHTSTHVNFLWQRDITVTKYI